MYSCRVCCPIAHQLIGVAHDAGLDDIRERGVLNVEIGLELAGDKGASHVSPPSFKTQPERNISDTTKVLTTMLTTVS